ncbi:MAG: dienelactone hydrolase family protein [Gemmatimonadetes bacterium]|uniref:Dienelactone hydrolase family protein n=1 Tax=Candidatus Kutchimonas denitrificans TaxID=3056748 RepID=A0AAE4Z7Z1_9BACT|nr:dienelactone hydrolase family protein [Gemmatimonadota bacterium]NIR75338.1 dienelactone hydrolase family protein [Candidatus Kutchimonas denitrificans]NIS00970.1 dienelactone hydrolase family protein [Gemmatimonadota bacterium]NIT66597.1 dienelactone hydrolase family protein [Gemmatimonadota bacterium]NIU53167.1 prolyl oligopeptidase family serine peptidase [Gemmatimonadota bacterium]
MTKGPKSVVVAVALAFMATACGGSESEGEMRAETEAAPQIETREVEYTVDGTVLQGFFAWDASTQETRPGVLVVHEWWGHNEHARNQARRLAEAGYVGFALDVYGKGKLATHPEDANEMMTEVLQAGVIPARFNAALELLKQDPHVDTEQIAAIGYCFGGQVVLEMARAGTDLDAVATFHGLLATDNPAAPGSIKARVLVLAGADDPFVPPEQITAFRQEMETAGARFEIVTYPGARHAFTNPDADSHGMEALAYDAEADRQSWARLLQMLNEVFG